MVLLSNPLTEQQISARIAVLEVEAGRAHRHRRVALVAAIAGPTAIQLRRLIGVEEADQSDANRWAIMAVILTLAALAFAVWSRHTAWRLRDELLALRLLRDAVAGKLRDLS